MKKLFINNFIIAALISLQPCFAGNFPLPASNDALVGDINFTSSDQTPVSIVQQYNVGMNAIIAANPGATENNFAEPYVKIPTQFLLPSVPRRGIVINLAEMRLYFYPQDGSVMTFPVGIGRVGKTIPIKYTSVTRKVVNPVWYPTPDIRKFNEKQGIDLPKAMPPGPDNPLGPYAIYLGIPTYLIHSTIFPESIGKRASFGCIRMNESDIKDFFPLVKANTPVTIIYMPTKVAWSGERLYAELHPPLEEHEHPSLNTIVDSVTSNVPHGHITLIDWQTLAHLAEQPDGVPHEIGFRVN